LSATAIPKSSSIRPPIRVVLADDEALFRVSLRQLLSVPASIINEVYGVEVGPGFDVVGEAATGEETVCVVEALEPDLLLLDLSMPRMSGLEALGQIGSCRHSVRTILLAGTVDRAQLAMAVHLGVRGLILKDVPTELLFEAIACVMGGEYWLGQPLVTHLVEMVRPLLASDTLSAGVPGRLTPRERQVLDLVVAGLSNKEIARQCDVSEQTIKHHLTRMFDKLGASTRLELAMVATRRGFDTRAS
jgi:two-component system, NarL family, nitrate/nitrite response regulator NarL